MDRDLECTMCGTYEWEEINNCNDDDHIYIHYMCENCHNRIRVIINKRTGKNKIVQED